MLRKLLYFQMSEVTWTGITLWIAAILLLYGDHTRADSLTIDEIPLAPLRIDGQQARAHTQGLEVAGASYYVTARREDVWPKQALLLRTSKTATHWDVWDITPRESDSAAMTFDHPGGMQSDGRRLWIPTAQSKPKSHSIIRAFAMAAMIAGQPLKEDFEFPVNDHIGALAVAADRKLLFGANWDTESVYVWDLRGHLKQMLTGSELGLRGLGAVAGPEGRTGLAVQDWKVIGDRLFASGMVREQSVAATAPRSRLASFVNFLESDFQRSTATLPLHKRTELAREAMAISDGDVFFIPEDLGPTNRILRVAITNLF